MCSMAKNEQKWENMTNMTTLARIAGLTIVGDVTRNQIAHHPL